MEVLQTFPSGHSGYDVMQVVFARRRDHYETHHILYAWLRDKDMESGIYWLPCLGILIKTKDFEDVLRLCPLHVYGGWATSKIEKNDKWDVVHTSMNIFSVIPECLRKFL